MCYNPIHLTNKGNAVPNRLSSYGEITSEIQYAYDVPCGKCEACKNGKIDSYVVRSIAELGRCNNRAVFVTLTYSDKNLPTYKKIIPPSALPYGDYVPGQTLNISVWNKSHVQKFLKKLNERILYHIGKYVFKLKRLVTINGHRCISQEWKEFLASTPRPIKYLFTCERGHADIYIDDKGITRQGTARPHYHGIIFLETPYVGSTYVLNLISVLWNYGRSYNIQIGNYGMCKSNINNPDRDIVQSLKYVCKYVTKDITDVCCNLCYKSHEDELQHKPFMLISHGLGDNLLEEKSDSFIENCIVNGTTIADTITARVVPTPRYNILKSKMYVRRKVGKFVTERQENGYWVIDDNLYPIWIDEIASDYHIYTKYETYLTPFGQKVNQQLRDKRVEYFLTTLKSIQLNPESFNLVSSLSYSLCDKSKLDDILSVTPDELACFVATLYKSNDYLDNDTLYRVYLELRNYNNTLAIKKRKEFDSEYKKHLDKAVIERPELFNVQPINPIKNYE